MDPTGPDETERRLRARAQEIGVSPSGRRADLGTAVAGMCRLAVAELEVLGAVVTLRALPSADPSAPASHAVAGSSDETSHAWEELQFSVGEGPGLDAFATGRPVLVSDLEASFARWPAYVPLALRAGLGSAWAFPLQLGAVRLGSQTLYAAPPRALDASDLTTALILAELTTELLIATSDTHGGGALDPGLDRALRFRTEVYQAQGAVAVQLGVSLADALLLMRARAFADDRDLTELAVAILDGSTRLDHHDE